MSEMIQYLADWRVLLVALVIFGFFPGLGARLVAMTYRKGDPRRDEIIAEVYAVPRWERPFWVFEQLERAFSEGARERLYDAADGRLFNRWKLGDGVERHLASPDTFWIPAPAELDTLQRGDLVKLMFEVAGPTHGFPGAGERMWAAITDIRGDKLQAKLANEPVMFGHLDLGRTIKFSRRHIVDYEYAEDGLSNLGPEPARGDHES
jgi:hypothetical protein